MAVAGQLMFARRLGPAARLIIWILVGLACVVLDTRLHALEGLRSGLSVLLQPVREAMRAPTEVASELGGFFTRHRTLQKERDALLAEQRRLRVALDTAADVARENAELRAMLQLDGLPGRKAVAASLLYQGHDWFAQRIALDRGTRAGLREGLPVVDGAGLVGQVIRVYPGTSEVMLVTNSGQLTPVYIERTGQRGLAAGSGQGRMELRYMPIHTDVRPGDRLLTSGIDRIYPSGIPVARVLRVTRPQAGPYLRIECVPLAGIDRARSVLVMTSVAGDDAR
jgi:rod shape-determining protein MreC